MGKMGKVEKISVSLPKEMVETVNEAVESGDYATTSEVVREALRKWESDRAYNRAIKTYGLDRLRSLVREGMDALDRGEGIPAEKVFAELRQKYSAMAKAGAQEMTKKKPAKRRQ